MNEPIYILKLGLENVRCFGEKAELDLSDGNGNWRQWTVIVGDNGLGKTTLLQVLAGLETEETKYTDNIKRYHIKLSSYIFEDKFTMPAHINAKDPLLGITLLYNSDEVYTHIKRTSEFRIERGSLLFNLEVIGYGANRFMSSTSLTDSKSENSATLFDDDAKLINAEEWLLQLDYASSRDSELKAFAKQRKNLVTEILIELLPDVTNIRFTEPTKESLTPKIEFLTSFGWVRIHELSLGYKTMVAWMVDLAARMFDRYPESENPLAEPAIVLVDEIDLHLHPKWQRKIFEYLSEKFPKTQFVVTAHSPLVVQSAPKDANIVVLRRDGDHVIIDNDVESVENWRLDQIMSALYGIESSRGPETEKWLEERRELLRKRDRLPEDEARLKILNEKAEDLPTADKAEDIEAMDIIRKAAHYLKNKVGVE